MNAPQVEKPLVLVTGSTGLIGNKVIQRLTNDFKVVGMDIHEPEDSHTEMEWRRCDLTRDDDVNTTLNGIAADFGREIASVIHLAAYYNFSGEPSPLYEKLTVNGSRRLIRKLQEFQVHQFVFSSSLLVMESAENSITEASPLHAEWDYPRSKVEAEKALRSEHRNTPLVILRLAGAYDENGHSPPLCHHIARIFERKLESYVFPGVTDHGQPFIHLEDVADCFRTVVDRRERLDSEETFLIAEPEVLSHEELQDTLGSLIHGKEWPTIRIPKPMAKTGAWVKEKLSQEEQFIKPWMIDLADQNYPVSIQHARERLGWEPARRLRQTLPRMVASLKADPRAFYERNGLPKPDRLEELAAQMAATANSERF